MLEKLKFFADSALTIMVVVVLLVMLYGTIANIGQEISHSPSVPEIDYDMRNQVVAIYNDHRAASESIPNGTGFYLGNGYIMTNQHVTRGREEFSISTYYGHYHIVELIAENEEMDFAILKVHAKLRNTVPVTMECRMPVYTEEIRMIGHPSRQKFLTAFGRVAGDYYYERHFIGRHVVPVNSTVVRGMSGGPVFSENETVIGQMFATLASPIQMNMRGVFGSAQVDFGFVTPANEICDYLDEIGIDYDRT
jgi:S1-C subfamily serine protease